MCAVNKTKKGFNNSMGCNLKKYKFNHLCDPFTSTPIKATIISAINKRIKIGTIDFFKKFNSKKEIKNIKHNDNNE